MTNKKISPDDPRLTAYALGEMEPGEARDFAAQIENDAEAKAALEAIRLLGDSLRMELASETGKLSEAAADAAREGKAGEAGDVIALPKQRSDSARAMVYWCGGLAAAACFALLATFSPTENRQKLGRLREVEPPPEQARAEAVRQKAIDDAAVLEKRVLKEEAIRKAQDIPHRRQPEPLDFSTSSPSVAKSNIEQLREDVKKPATSEIPALANLPKEEDEVIELSPFEVEGSVDAGYVASQTLAGTRIRTDLVDVPSSISVVTKEMLRDVSAGSQSTVLSYGAKPSFAAAKGEGYAASYESGYSLVSANPTSTFSIDVDTASYANVRRFIEGGQRPPREAVRIEELVNYFPYDYVAPEAKSDVPVRASLEVASAPWNAAHRLVRVGLKAREVPEADRPAANLVFLLDVSGSMDAPNKLPLVKQAMKLLVERMRPQDHVAIVTYAGASGLALPSTAGDAKAEILGALESLQPGGSTYGSMGIQLAYDIAKANFVTGGTNRVVLCTDGDFNVGVTSQTELQTLIEQKAKSGVFLTVLGFGMGNYQDSTLETLADKGNGNYGYVDSLQEARKLLVEQAGGTLMAVAKDVKVQVEFNPAKVVSYRLIGYENRRLNREDFANDKIDAGEMGSGHCVTALYEVVPVGGAETPALEPLKYQTGAADAKQVSAELLTVSVRYKPVSGDRSEKLSFPLLDAGRGFEAASRDFRFAASVAAFGLVLTDSSHRNGASLDDVRSWATAAVGDSADSLRREFVGLVERAAGLKR